MKAFRTTSASGPKAIVAARSADLKPLKDATAFPALRAPNGKQWTWGDEDLWTPVGGGNAVMSVLGGMLLAADEDGNWFCQYDVESHVPRHTWTYAFEARSKHGTPLFTFAPNLQRRGNGGFRVIASGRAADIRRDYGHIAAWRRLGLAGEARV